MNERNNSNETKTTAVELTDAELEQAGGGGGICSKCGREFCSHAFDEGRNTLSIGW